MHMYQIANQLNDLFIAFLFKRSIVLTCFGNCDICINKNKTVVLVYDFITGNHQ